MFTPTSRVSAYRNYRASQTESLNLHLLPLLDSKTEQSSAGILSAAISKNSRATFRIAVVSSSGGQTKVAYPVSSFCIMKKIFNFYLSILDFLSVFGKNKRRSKSKNSMDFWKLIEMQLHILHQH